LAGRYGGDEFCVILPDMPLEQAAQVMERMREVFSNYRCPEIPELRVSLSIGLASFQDTFTDASMWLNAADRALYAATDAGRNRVNISGCVIAHSAWGLGSSCVRRGARSIVLHCLTPMIRAPYDPR